MIGHNILNKMNIFFLNYNLIIIVFLRFKWNILDLDPFAQSYYDLDLIDLYVNYIILQNDPSPNNLLRS